MNIKLKNGFPMMITKFSAISEQIIPHAQNVKNSDEYRNLVTRVAYDCFYMCFTPDERCEFYDMLEANYPGYTDKHLKTLLEKALLAVCPEIVDL